MRRNECPCCSASSRFSSRLQAPSCTSRRMSGPGRWSSCSTASHPRRRPSRICAAAHRRITAAFRSTCSDSASRPPARTTRSRSTWRRSRRHHPLAAPARAVHPGGPLARQPALQPLCRAVSGAGEPPGDGEPSDLPRPDRSSTTGSSGCSWAPTCGPTSSCAPTRLFTIAKRRARRQAAQDLSRSSRSRSAIGMPS